MLKMHHVVGSVLLLLIVSEVVQAQSQPPSPRPPNSSQPPQSKSKGSKQQTANDLRGTEQSPLVIKVLPTPKTKEESAQDRNDHNEKAATDWWLVRFNGALVVVVFLQWIWMVRQEKWMRKNIEIAQKAADAAKESAEVAQTTVKTMEDTAERQLRAYIHVGGGKDKGPILDAPDGPEVWLLLKNTGQTPAYKVEHWIKAGILPYPLNSDLTGPDESAKMTKIVLPPGVEMNLFWKTGTPLERAQIDAIRDGTECRLYVWGEVHYLDAFDKPRFTKFRFMHGGPTRGVDIEACEEGNDAN
jgi:hypothetical protein